MSNEDASTLNPALQRSVRDLCREGYASYDAGDYRQAIRHFFAAWTRLPKPQTQWEEAGWVLTALGDAYFAKGSYEQAREAMESALHCPGTAGNPFIYLRLSQALYELGQREQAREAARQAPADKLAELMAVEPPQYQWLIEEQNA